MEEDHSHAYVTHASHMDKNMNARTHAPVTSSRCKSPFLDCLFDSRKRARTCVYVSVHRKEVTRALCVCRRVCVLPSANLSPFPS